jgi:hypothetical protein
MKEIDFYNEFAEKFIKYLYGYLDESFEIAYSQNKSLDSMISELCDLFGVTNPFPNEYIPKLKLDILFGIKQGGRIHFVLVEAKYLTQLSLKDYSQLTGYLQVAKNIGTGLLLLIVKGTLPNKLSSDFGEILKLNKLPMDWTVTVQNSEFDFKTGILTYLPGNGIRTQNVNGISDFEQLVRIITDDFQ